MRFDRNRSLRNLKFFFEIEIFSQYKISVLVGSLTPPPTPGGKYSLGIVIFQDGYLRGLHGPGPGPRPVPESARGPSRAGRWEMVFPTGWAWRQIRGDFSDEPGRDSKWQVTFPTGWAMPAKEKLVFKRPDRATKKARQKILRFNPGQ